MIPQEMIPQEGQMVRVRQRRWLVDGVIRFAKSGPRVQLSCVEDEAAGESLEVLWEHELDAKILSGSAQSLEAEVLDEPRAFGAYLHAIRWNCVTSTDAGLLQSPFRAGIDLKAYQLEPLRKALTLPRVNLFIADDVGLGKTIEGGLVAQELKLRQRVDFIVIVAPPAVTRQWQEEMEQRFGLHFELYDRDYVAARRKERGWSINPWTTHNRFIVSFAMLRGMKSSKKTGRRTPHLELLLSHLEAKRGKHSVLRKSMLIIDEAHQAAPSSRSLYPVDSRTTRAVRQLTDFFEHKLFLSATPHNGHSSSFSSLLEMLDNQRFTRGVPIAGAEELKPIMVRRLKRHLQNEQGGFPIRKLVDHFIDIPAPDQEPEIQLGRLLKEYEQLYRSSLVDLSKKERAARLLVLISLHKRLLSSITGFHRTLSKHVAAAEKLFGNAEVAQKAMNKRIGKADLRDTEELFSDAELDAQEDEFVEYATICPSEKAMKVLRQMKDIASAARNEPDARLKELAKWINQNLISEKRWNDRKVVIFTEYDDTLQWLVKQLPVLIKADCDKRIDKYHGGLGEQRREELKKAFNTDPRAHPLRILIATDAAREGINLQAHCADLFHFDLPWNPSRVEQRNGRIDRVLQPSQEVRCHYFIVKQRPEDKVLKYVVKKLENIRSELGSVSEVISGDMGAFVEGRLWELSEKYADVDTFKAAAVDNHEDLMPDIDQHKSSIEEAAQKAHAQLESENASLLRGDLDQLDELLNRSQKQLSYKAEHLYDLVDLGLSMFSKSQTGLIPVLPLSDPPAYHLPTDLDISWRPVLERMRKDRTEFMKKWQEADLKPVTFKAAHKLDADSIQLHLGHPLVLRLLSRFRSQGFSSHDLSRVTLLTNTQDKLRRVIAFARLTIFGLHATRLHEEMLVVSAKTLRDNTLEVFKTQGMQTTIEQLFDRLEGAPQLHPSHTFRSDVLKRTGSDFKFLWELLEKKGQEQRGIAEGLLKERGESEAQKIRELLERQRKRILETKSEHQQLNLEFTEKDAEQKEQYRRDVQFWEERLKLIEKELETEPDSIKQYFETVRARIEPVGMVYLWPEG